jgi:hypothetical protein
LVVLSYLRFNILVPSCVNPNSINLDKPLRPPLDISPCVDNLAPLGITLAAALNKMSFSLRVKALGLLLSFGLKCIE